jgi:hypothetical protein
MHFAALKSSSAPLSVLAYLYYRPISEKMEGKCKNQASVRGAGMGLDLPNYAGSTLLVI